MNVCKYNFITSTLILDLTLPNYQIHILYKYNALVAVGKNVVLAHMIYSHLLIRVLSFY